MAEQTASFSVSMSIYLISIIKWVLPFGRQAGVHWDDTNTACRSASSIPGRVIMASLADKLGYFNMMTIISLLSAVAIITLWVPFDYHPTHAGLMVFALVYGYASGGFVSLLMPCAAKSGSLQTLGQRFGTFQLVMSFRWVPLYCSCFVYLAHIT